jgi:hypothetical protein
MARVAVVLDPVFKRVGLSGRSVIPFVIGTGCAVPGVMACRTIRDERERRATAMLAPSMPCGAKLPVISLFAGVFFGGEISEAVFVIGRHVVHHKGLDGIVEKNVCLVLTCHQRSKAIDSAIVTGILTLFQEDLGIIGRENVNTERILKRNRGIHLVDSDLVALSVSRYLAHNVRTVVSVGDGGYKLRGEHISAHKLGQGMKHIDAGNVHMSDQREEISLENNVVSYVVLKQNVTREASIIFCAIVAYLGVVALLKKL